ncbi:YheC/YheD family protein [Cohnella zeiphila]|uniref:YheC/YheD family protein n=1 Tax=Cohnella zeiphila TaxID=2761120 RepID=A0A7X0SKK0_9BACL|nr:YheC/YheD family protein [Cohnella zeiphila]MBB6731697.1 YheC/YheD family protein [Cohnella zeiphila]
MAIQRVRSKKAKTEALLANPKMREHIPETTTMHRDSVREMLGRYGMIYVKPVNGTFGQGVIRIEKNQRAPYPYRFQAGERKYRFETFERMFEELQTVKRKKNYLVQQGIELLKHDGRRFDFRVMVQRSPQNRWESTGIIGRLANPRKIVTNYHSGGTPMPPEDLLREHLGGTPALHSFMQKLRGLGEDVARTLERRFPRLKEIGVDVAVGEDLKPWILEVNTLPDPFIFRKLRDRSVFRRIYSYAVAYGRFSRK